MVVVHAEPSTSTTPPHKKNRRKMSKKQVNSSADIQNHEEDADMQGEDFAASAEAAQAAIIEEDNGSADDDELMIDSDPSSLPTQNAAPAFPALPASAQRTTLKSETRRIPIPPHRMTPLKKEWVNIFGPLTEILGLQVRMNVQRKSVEIRVCMEGHLNISLILIAVSYPTDFETYERNWCSSEGSRLRKIIRTWL